MENRIKTRVELVNIVKSQLAIEYNCSIDDFTSGNNLITVQKNNPKRRHYIDGSFFLQMVTFGKNVVITSDERMHEWLRNFTKDKTGHWLFEHNNLMEVDNKLRDFNKKLYQSHHMFLPFMQVSPGKNDIKIRWFEEDEIHQFYESKKYPNALSKEYNPKRPDVLAVASYDGDQITAMAACSADTPLLWQIGIDVDENYRGKGIGTYLVSLLKNEIEKRGKIAFYGTSLSNLFSWAVALKSGFFPVWIEISTIEDF